MSGPQKLYLFGDQTYEVQPHLKDLLRYRTNPVLDDFLVKAYDVIRNHIYELPIQVRDDLPRFTCVDDLLLMKPTSTRCIPLDMAITCLYQLGVFISQTDLEYPRLDNARVLGLCTGTLAAAAVSCSRSTLDLIPLAVAAVSAAFKTGMHVTDLAHRVQPSPDATTGLTWSMLAAASESTTEALSKFCEETKLPLTDRPYVSAVAPSAITISGPPNSLAKLISSDHFAGIRIKRIPIFAPYHCPHLCSQDDVEDIVAGLDATTAQRRNETPVLSTAGTVVGVENFEFLLKEAISQILLQPISWSGVIDEVQKWLNASDAESFNISAIATIADQLIYNALKQSSLKNLVSSTPAQPKLNTPKQAPGNPKQPKLAIIGLSGRYPDAKDNEAFWNLLYQGLDVHKEVPAFHWDAKTHVDPTGKIKNTSTTPYGCWLDNPKEFDCKFFNIR